MISFEGGIFAIFRNSRVMIYPFRSDLKLLLRVQLFHLDKISNDLSMTQH